MMSKTALVFIVDDDDSVRKSLSRVATAAGYAVEAVRCVLAEAVPLLASRERQVWKRL